MGTDDDKAPKITLSPKPPTRGQKMTISVEGMTLPVTIYLDWDPSGTPTSVEVGTSGSATVTVPSNAASLIATGGGAQPVSTTVSP